MAGEAHVADLDPFDLLDTESERAARFFADLDPDKLERSTRCEGWRVREIISHLDGVEVYHRACLDDAIPKLFEEAAKGGVTDMKDFNDWIVRERANRKPEDVRGSWQAANAEVRKRLRERGRDGSLSTSVGPYPVGLMAFHIASEYATHADDMDVEIPPEEQAGRTAWRAQVSRFALEEAEKPVRVEVDGDVYVVERRAKSSSSARQTSSRPSRRA